MPPIYSDERVDHWALPKFGVSSAADAVSS
jgi:hypothetical protein